MENTNSSIQELGGLRAECFPDSIVLKWEPFSSSGDNPVSYQVYYKDNSSIDNNWIPLPCEESDTFTLTDLQPDTEYAIFVRAYSDSGVIGSYPVEDEYITARTTVAPVIQETPPPRDWKKIAIFGGSGLAAIALIALLVGLLKPKGTDTIPSDTPPETPAVVDTTSIETPPEPPKEVKFVYSCAYDGFVNMHETPSYDGANVGKFLNGPEGAILLEDLGDWTKIDVNGVVGYVASKYVQDTPTVAYTGTVDVNWLEGVWAASGYDKVEIFNNGVFRSLPSTQVGTWILQNNEIKFTLVYVEDADEDEEEEQTVFTETLPIKQSPDGLGEFRRQRFYSQQEYDQYGAPGTYTKAGFRETGQNLLTMVESYSTKQ